MANVKITELSPASTPLAGTELIEIVQGGVNKKVEVNEVGGGGGVTEFIELTDVPASYTGQASKVVAVKADESGLEFVAGGGSQDLQDTLDNGKTATFTGVGGEDISINMGGDDGGGEAVDFLIMNKTVVDDTYSTQRFQKVNILSYSSTIENSVTEETKVSVISLSDGEFSIEKQNSYTLGAKISSQLLQLEDIAEVDISGTNLDVIFKPKPKFVSGTYYLVDEDYVTNAIAGVTTPDATPTVKGIAKLYTSLGSNTDGAVDQNTVNTALQGFIPLTGTEVGSPVTGDFEVVPVFKIKTRNSNDDNFNEFYIDDGGLQLNARKSLTDISSLMVSSLLVEYSNTDPYSQGFRGTQDFSPNYDDNTYVQKIYVDNAIAGVTTPDATSTTKGKAKLYTSLGSNTDGAVDQNTVNTALSAKANAPLIDTVSSSALTGVTTEGILKSYLIPANTYSASEILNFANDLYKTGTAGTVTSRLYTNTTNSLSGASLLAVNISTSGSRKIALRRQLVLKDGNIETLATTATVPDDNVNSGTVATIVTFNPAVDNYFITTAQNASTGDSTIQNNFKIHF